MSIYRIKRDRDNPYVMVNKAWVNDPGLSAKAKGILLYLLSKPDDWSVRESDIIAHMRDGRDSVRAGLRELIALGYIVRSSIREVTGRYLSNEYDVFENPTAATLPSADGKPVAGKPHTTNIELTNTRNKNREPHADEQDLGLSRLRLVGETFPRS